MCKTFLHRTSSRDATQRHSKNEDHKGEDGTKTKDEWGCLNSDSKMILWKRIDIITVEGRQGRGTEVGLKITEGVNDREKGG